MDIDLRNVGVNMKIHVSQIFVLLGLGIAAFEVSASSERLVWADVDRVEPIQQIVYSPSKDQSCWQVPARREGLVARLSWDLRTDCADQKTLRVDGYRVHYRWAGRNYVHTMDNPPGEKIALKVEVDLRY